MRAVLQCPKEKMHREKRKNNSKSEAAAQPARIAPTLHFVPGRASLVKRTLAGCSMQCKIVVSELDRTIGYLSDIKIYEILKVI
jgi:hypothetical protein